MTANCALFKPIGRTLDPTIIIGQHTPTVKPFTSLNLTLSQIPLFKTKNMGVNPQVNLTHPMLALSGANPFNTISILIHLVSVPKLFFNIFGVCSISILTHNAVTLPQCSN